jgi:hypothetical protein
MGAGTGTTAVAQNNTQLVTPLNARVALTSTTRVTNTTTNDSVDYVGTFGAGSWAGNITEAGLFVTPGGSDLAARTVFTAIPKTIDDTLAFTWRIILA